MGKANDGRKLPRGITQMPGGLYRGRVTYAKKTETIYNRSLSELKKQMTDLRYELEHGTFVKTTSITVNDWFEEWITTYKEPTVKKGTIKAYRGQYNAFLKDEIGNTKLSDIRAGHLQKVLNQMQKDGYHDGTIRLTHDLLSGIFGQAYKSELIQKDPVSIMTRPKGKEAEERVVFTREQQAIYMKYAERYCYKNLLQLAICTGMRNGELRGLQWQDVDFKNKVIHVRHTMTDDGLDTPKTKTSLRDIPMMGRAYDILKEQEKEYKEQRGSVVKMVNDDFVFSAFGKPLSKYNIKYILGKMLKDMRADGVEFPYFTLHSTRHTFATRCIEAGMQPQVLKTILGHSSLAMTMDLYSHVLPDTKKEEMEKVEDAFADAVGM